MTLWRSRPSGATRRSNLYRELDIYSPQRGSVKENFTAPSGRQRQGGRESCCSPEEQGACYNRRVEDPCQTRFPPEKRYSKSSRRTECAVTRALRKRPS